MSPPRITRRAALAPHLGAEVIVVGDPAQAKAGPVVRVERVPVYLPGLEPWPAATLRTRVEVRGVLRRGALLPPAEAGEGGERTAGADGAQWWLEGARPVVAARP